MRSAIAFAVITLGGHVAAAAPARCSHATALQLAHKLASRFGDEAARSTADDAEQPPDDPSDAAGHARIDGPPRDDGNLSGYLTADCVAGRIRRQGGVRVRRIPGRRWRTRASSGPTNRTDEGWRSRRGGYDIRASQLKP